MLRIPIGFRYQSVPRGIDLLLLHMHCQLHSSTVAVTMHALNLTLNVSEVPIPAT